MQIEKSWIEIRSLMANDEFRGYLDADEEREWESENAHQNGAASEECAEKLVISGRVGIVCEESQFNCLAATSLIVRMTVSHGLLTRTTGQDAVNVLADINFRNKTKKNEEIVKQNVCRVVMSFRETRLATNFARRMALARCRSLLFDLMATQFSGLPMAHRNCCARRVLNNCLPLRARRYFQWHKSCSRYEMSSRVAQNATFLFRYQARDITDF